MSVRHAAISLLTMTLILFSAPAAAQKFTAWHGKYQVYEGEGGEMEETNGIQFWSNGDPPKPFVLVGYISDTRLSTGLLGKMRLKNRAKEIAEIARKNGGDAVILVDSETATKGYVANYNASTSRIGSSSSGNASGFGTAVQNENTRYAVIKYVEAEPGDAATAPEAKASATSTSPPDSN